MSSLESPVCLPQLRRFFEEHVPGAASAPLGPDTQLLGTGLLDSLSVIQLMMFLGSEFDIRIDDEDFTPENLGTVGRLVAFIERKKAAS